MTTILSKERVDGFANPTCDDVDCPCHEVASMAIELSELRALVARKPLEHNTQLAVFPHKAYCSFCRKLQLNGNEETHSPDCPVSRYTAYRKEVE
jgi:hypothetical protein